MTSPNISRPFKLIVSAILVTFLSIKTSEAAYASPFTASTLAGTRSGTLGTTYYGSSGNNVQATSSLINCPAGVYLRPDGLVYFSDSENNQVRKIDQTTGLMSIFAGTGSAGSTGQNVKATSATLRTPTGVWQDTLNNVYITEQDGDKIRKVDLNGIITSFAGTGSAATTSSSGDNRQATSALLNAPTAIYGDNNNNLYFTDKGISRIRVINLNTKIVTLFAGTGEGDNTRGNGGKATSADFDKPFGIFVNTAGDVYFTDMNEHYVRKINGNTMIITSYAGTI